MKKLFLLLCVTVVFLDASVLVIKASKNIKYKSKIKIEDTFLTYVNSVRSSCIPLNKNDMLSNQYRAKLYIKKGRVICKKDVYLAQKNRLLFDFGSIEIERDGKIIRETEDYIRIKDEDGNIDKIYKDGINR